MNNYEWNDSLSLGIEVLDADHRRLIELLNDMAAAVAEGRPQEHLARVFDELLVHAGEHFAREETFMQRAAYPGYEGHLAVHESITAKLHALRAQVGAINVDRLSHDVVDFLNAWLLEHIVLNDLQMRPYFEQAGLTDIASEHPTRAPQGASAEAQVAWALHALADGERLVGMDGIGEAGVNGELARGLERLRALLIRNDLLIAENRSDRSSLQSARRTVDQLSEVVTQLPVAVVITDPDGIVKYVNPYFESATGIQRQQILGDAFPLLYVDDSGSGVLEKMWRVLKAGKVWQEERENRDPRGTVRWESITVSPVREREAVTSFAVVIEDITERKQHEARIRHDALHDALTGLPNRILVVDRLQQGIDIASRAEHKLVLMFIDLDDFKKVNDSLGHHIGDELLLAVAERIAAATRASDTVARQGGDEFLVVANGLTDRIQAEPIARAVIRALARSFRISGMELRINCSIGVAFFPEDGDGPELLLRKADAAMYRAKADGGGVFRYFDASMDASAARRLELERRLHHALEKRRLSLAFQPLIDGRSRELIGAEALLRWNDAELGRVSPEEFIPVAENTGMIVPIGAWVMREAVKQAKLWSLQLGQEFSISVNASPRQLLEEDFVASVCRELKDYGLPSNCLQIEVTEGLLVRNKTQVHQVLDELSAAGIRIAMDDFGTGYSSLSHLREFPFDVIKIDRSFVRDMCTDDNDAELVFATVAMARSLHLSVTAEGVETRDQMRALARAECHTLQGYLFSAPVPVEEFTRRFVTARPPDYDDREGIFPNCASQ